MMLTSGECLAKAAELERVAESCAIPSLAAEYRALACHWRIVALARMAASSRASKAKKPKGYAKLSQKEKFIAEAKEFEA